METVLIEEWKHIGNGVEVSSFGNVRKLDGKPIKCSTHKYGYKQIYFNGNTHSLHRLVAEAFIPRPIQPEDTHPDDLKKVINHIDCNPLNNRIDNLEWVTYRENTRHAMKLGRTKFFGNKKDELNHASRRVINTKTGEEYPSLKRAVEATTVYTDSIYRKIGRMLNGHIPNETHLAYY